MGYIKQLDSVRAIAVLLVIIWHWIPKESFINKFQTGPFGVNIFFVLSGFLITQILLKNRNEVEESLVKAKTTILKSYYIRRVLRIFPIYYLTIFLMVVLRHKLNLSITTGELISNITYTSNFFIYSTKSWPTASPHFWSLAVEEQFYLFWPLLMLYFPSKYLIHCILFFIIAGIVSQSFIKDYNFGYLPLNTCFDCLGMGALLAWIVVYKPVFLPKFYMIINLSAILSVGIIIFNLLKISHIVQIRFFHSILGVWIITYILNFRNKKTILLSILDNRFLINIGKVSYGIYLYHILYSDLAFHIWNKFLFKFSITLSDSYYHWLFFVVNFWILLFICRLSWKYVEKPILTLKENFKYQ